MSDYIGDYEYNKKDLIGHGAFAIVYKGRQKSVIFIKNYTLFFYLFVFKIFRFHKIKSQLK